MENGNSFRHMETDGWDATRLEHGARIIPNKQDYRRKEAIKERYDAVI